ncbi:hypothetical protein RND81_14G095200 [Saponaria officinalis]|uniref:SHSP domain-containing protein n=1 Tax=Saponaria officinalis TaxID=3572 RepID=A0AAW1GN70_SAPOF
MASKVLTCSPSLVLSNKATSTSPKAAIRPQSISFRGPTSPKTTLSTHRVSSLVVRAQSEDGLSKEISNVDPLSMRKDLSHLDPLIHSNLNKRVALIDNPPYIRTPWNSAEDENEIRMWFDMPGLTAPGIDVNVVDHILIVKGTEGVDAFGRTIHSPFDCKLQLPFNCAKEETRAVLKNGVLCISVPKITKSEHMKFIHVPVRAI